MRVLLLLLLPLSVHATELPLTEDTYEVSWREMALGEGTVVLQKDRRANCYRYRSETRPSGFIRMFYGSPQEASEFCVVNGRVRPNSFRFIADEDDSYGLDFDWKKRRVSGGELPERALAADGVDHFSIQQAVRLWTMNNAGKKKPGKLKLTLVEKNGDQTYVFAIAGRESIRVPAGEFDCVRVELVGHERKLIRYWLAPDDDWRLVRLEHRKDGKQQLLLVLKD